jgi:hemoglobin
MDDADRLQVQDSVERIRGQMDAFGKCFFEQLFQRRPALKELLSTEEARRSKLRSMLATLAKSRDIDKIAPAICRLGDRHRDYGVGADDYAPLHQALLHAVGQTDPQGASGRVQQAWAAQLKRISVLMEPSAGQSQVPEPDSSGSAVAIIDKPSAIAGSLYQEVGGYEVVERVHRRFYENIFAEPWLGFFFNTKSISSLVLKQTKFMVAAFGGPDDYHWDTPAIAHMHMFVTDEQADIREILLRNAIRQEGLSQPLEDRWLAVDQAFRPAIVKHREAECVMRCPGQVAVVAARPAGYRPPRLLARGQQDEPDRRAG